MLEKEEVITLDDNIDYVVAATTIIDNIQYVYLMDIEDYSNFMFCSFNNDEVEEVEDPDLQAELIRIFNEQLNGR